MRSGIHKGGEVGCVDVEVLASVRGLWTRRVAASVNETERPASLQGRQRRPRSARARATVDEQDFGPFALAQNRNPVHRDDGREASWRRGRLARGAEAPGEGGDGRVEFFHHV